MPVGTESRARAGRWIARGGIALLALLAVAVLLLSLPAVRTALLRAVLHRVGAAAPGSIEFERLGWPTPGTVTIQGAGWVVESDTLLAVDSLSVSVDWISLLRRDLRIRRASGRRLRIDVPALRTQVTPTKASPGARGFLRPGAVAGFPSVSLDEATWTVASCRVAPNQPALSGDIEGSFDLRADRPPRLHLAHVRVEGPSWAIHEAELAVDLLAGSMEGRGRGDVFPGWPWEFQASSPGSDRWRIRLVPAGGSAPPDGIGIDVSSTLHRDSGTVHAIASRAELCLPSVEELRAYPPLDSLLADWPPVERVPLVLEAELTLHPTLTAKATATVRRSAWIESGRADLRYRRGSLRIDSLALRLADLTVEAAGGVTADSAIGRARITVAGAEWLSRIAPQELSIDSLVMQIDAHICGPRDAPSLEVEARAAGRVGNLAVEHLDLQARTEALHQRAIAVALRAGARGHEARLTGEIDPDPGALIARLSPLWIGCGDRPADTTGASMPLSGLLRRENEGGRVRLSPLRVTGDYGDILIEMDAVPDGEMSLRLRGEWPDPPSVLSIRLPDTGDRMDSLRAAWRRNGPYTVALRAWGTPRKAEATGILRLPGAGTLTPFLPPGARLEEIEPLQGSFSAHGTLGDSTSFSLTLDLGDTHGLDSSRVELRGGEDLVLERLLLQLEGLKLEAAGSRRQGSWMGRADLELPDSRFLRRLGLLASDSLDLQCRATATLDGATAAPHVRFSARGSAAAPGIEVPDVSAEGFWRGGRLTAMVEAARGVRNRLTPIDRVRVALASLEDQEGVLPARIRWIAKGPDLELRHSAVLQSGSAWSAETDSLAIRLGPEGLRNATPFALRYQPETRALAIEHLHLEGGMGTVTLHGAISPDTAHGEARIHVDLPSQCPLAGLPQGLWPRHAELNLSAEGRDALTARGQVTGLRWGGVLPVDAHFELTTGTGRARATVTVQDSLGPMVVAQAEASGRQRREPYGRELEADIEVNRLPLRWGREGAPTGVAPHLSGELIVRGSRADPSGFFSGSIRFPESPELRPFRLDLAAALAGSSGLDPRIIHPSRRGTEPGPGELLARVRITAPDDTLVTGSARYPLSWSLAPPGLRIREAEALEIHLDADGLPLTTLSPLLPADIGLAGTCQLHLSASGPAGDPALRGNLSIPELLFSTADGSRVTARTGMALAGQRSHPRLTGEIDVRRGLLRIPDPPRTLHATRGSAVLWDSTTARPTPLEPADRIGERTAWESPMDLDLSVNIPSGFWIRGRGLEVELAGDLELVRAETEPILTGELRAVRGQMVFLGRIFQMAQGRVVFHGQAEVNPTLDVTLSSNIEGHLIDVRILGTLKQPEVLLSSDPEMSEGNIIAFLLFGRRVDELDGDQMGLVQRRAAEMAAAYGSAQLEARLSRQLGVDFLQFRQGSNGQALVIGKYISRRALLRYEQSLEDRALMFLNLEYFLSRHLKIETLLGPREQSAIEVNWESEY